MGARILKLPLAGAGQAAGHSATEHSTPHKFLFWRGASGRRYVHTVYSLIECPEVASANYILVKVDDDGQRHVLRIGRAEDRAGSLNLAEIRKLGAELGANEVHVHLLAGDEKQSKLIEFDLRAGQFDTLSPEPDTRYVH